MRNETYLDEVGQQMGHSFLPPLAWFDRIWQELGLDKELTRNVHEQYKRLRKRTFHERYERAHKQCTNDKLHRDENVHDDRFASKKRKKE
ncbi:hypothetical protein AAVH_25518 [Aphelenchoides avenae]|nr:hypothetical protein AAVH_25518 [Aphelenchus avenae]